MHGISYISDTTLPSPHRVIWLLILLSFACLATFLVVESYTEWQDNPVITTLSTVAKPVNTLLFPSVTICGAGQHLDNVERLLYQDFVKWRSYKSNNATETSLEDQFAAFLNERFQIEKKGVSLMDVLNMMVSPNEEAVNANLVRENLITNIQPLPSRVNLT